MKHDDIAELRAHGFTDAAIHDATQVIAYFNFITRIAGALGVDQETFIRAGKNTNRFQVDAGASTKFRIYRVT